MAVRWKNSWRFFCPVKSITLELYEAKEHLQNNLKCKIQDATINILVLEKAINPTDNWNAHSGLNSVSISRKEIEQKMCLGTIKTLGSLLYSTSLGGCVNIWPIRPSVPGFWWWLSPEEHMIYHIFICMRYKNGKEILYQNFMQTHIRVQEKRDLQILLPSSSLSIWLHCL